MNSLHLLSICILGLALGYFLYLKFLIKKIFLLNLQRLTPAREYQDGVDYVPAKNWLILFGHHFASIAGAGPIIGPVIAFSIWGWAPCLLWIILGAIFLGGVHDFSSLYISVRNKGYSISEIGAQTVSKRTKKLLSGFILLTLLLVITVFLYFCANTFVVMPEIVLPSLGLIPVAMIVGLLIYKFNFNTSISTLFGLLFLALLIYLGNLFPLVLKVQALNIWILVLLIYCFFASVIPVNILLQPRDYLSSFLLFLGIGFGLLGIFLQRFQIVTDAFVKFNFGLHPLWPMLFVTIACGAISGFHALIVGGTTSKQIANEMHMPRIGYGGMLLEALLASIVLISVAVLSPDIFKTTLEKTGPTGSFGKGYGYLTLPFLGSYGQGFAVLILNAFILTTLDTATRIMRYVFNEVFKLKNRCFPTLIILIVAGYLAFTGKWMNIWPMFGAANQLIAALALIVVSSWLLKQNKKISYTFIPAIFMLMTTISAIIYKLNSFMKEGNYILTIISVILLLLSFSIIWEARFLIARRRT